MKLSVIIPAHNEERYIGYCIDSIRTAARNLPADIEIIVVLNRCTDATVQIAAEKNVIIIQNRDRNLSKIRNAGVMASTGDVVVTIDADCTMSENVLHEVCKAMQSEKYIGGGVRVIPERRSPGILATYLIIRISMLLSGFSGGMFWLSRKAFDCIGGFNETLVIAEDYDFAQRLKRFGRKNQKKFGELPYGHITASCRKFDVFGDWHMFSMVLKEGRLLLKCLKNKDTAFADKYYYDFNSKI